MVGTSEGALNKIRKPAKHGPRNCAELGQSSSLVFPAGAGKQEASWHSGEKAKGAFIRVHRRPATQ